MKRDTLRTQPIKNAWFLRLHFLICSAVLVKAATILGWSIYRQLPILTIAATFNEFFAEFSYWPKKPAELLAYVFSIASLAVYYAGALYLIANVKINDELLTAKILKTTSRVVAYFGALLFINVFLFWLLKIDATGFLLIIGVLAWVFITFLPVSGFVYSQLERLLARIPSRMARVAPVVLLALATLQIVTLFIPYISGTLKIPNDYFDIPEQTKLGDHYVDNTDYINQHQIGGLIKYSPDRDQGKTPQPLPGTYIALKKTDLLRNFIEQHETFPIITIIQERKLPLELTDFYLKSAKSRETRYYYNDDLGALVLHGKMSWQEKQELDRIVSDKERPLIDELFFKAGQYETFYAKRGYTTEELKFLERNRAELTAQAKAGWFFHHHSQMFVPMAEYAFGKPLAEIQAQYGKASTLLLKYIADRLGGLNFQNYFKGLYSIFPIYLAFAVLALAIIFRDVSYVFLGSILIYGSILLIGEQLLFIAPGFNPIRHFLDIPTVVVLYLYLTRHRPIFLILTLLFGVVAIAMSVEFGLALMASVLVVLGLRYFARDDRPSIMHIALTIAGAVAAIIVTVLSLSKNPMMIYYLLGVSAPSIEPLRLLVILGAISLMYLFTVSVWTAAGPNKYLFLFLFLYTQAAVIYYVWNPGIHHLLALSPIWSLMLMMMLRIIFGNYELDKFRRVSMFVATAFVVCLMYIPAFSWYYLSRANIASGFNSHRIYSWNFAMAKFQSTMDPSYFANSVDLINKYSPGKAIFIVSKYDNFLPFLAERYSALPFIQVSTSLVSQKEINLCIDAILKAAPRYIYVDTDIERNLNGDIFHERDPVTRLWGLYSESFSRVKVLNLQRKIYEGVSQAYKPVEKGLLITVYERKS